MSVASTLTVRWGDNAADLDGASQASHTNDADSIYSELSAPSSRAATVGSPNSNKLAYSRYSPEDCDKFVHAASVGCISVMEDLLKKRLVHPDSRHSCGNGWPARGDYTSLMVAAIHNNISVVEFLLRQTHPPTDLNLRATDELGGTALIIAAHRGNYRICELLYDNGADTGIISSHRGLTALDWAYKHNHVLCIDILDGSKSQREAAERKRLEDIRLAQEAERARIAAEEAQRVAEERATILAANQEQVEKLARFLSDGCGIPPEFIDKYVERIYLDLKLPSVSRIIKRNKEKLLAQMLVSIDVDDDHITKILTHLNIDI
jgi:hypothetical protein